MSRFEVEFAYSTAQWEYVHFRVNGDTIEEIEEALTEEIGHRLKVAWAKGKAGMLKQIEQATPEQLITSELGGKVISEVTNTNPDDSMKAYEVKPWERKKPAQPAAPKAADPNDPFANFK